MGEPVIRVSYEEYLAQAEASEVRLEFVDGVVYAMAGGSPTHSRLCIAVSAEIRGALKGRRCVVHGSDLRVFIQATRRATYPDVSVFCDALERAESDTLSATNPRLLVEVLSPSTESSDRGEKFAHYQTLASLEEYVLVSQVSPRVEVFSRVRDPAGRDEWRLRIYGPGDDVVLGSLDVAISLDAVYADPLAD